MDTGDNLLERAIADAEKKEIEIQRMRGVIHRQNAYISKELAHAKQGFERYLASLEGLLSDFIDLDHAREILEEKIRRVQSLRPGLGP